MISALFVAGVVVVLIMTWIFGFYAGLRRGAKVYQDRIEQRSIQARERGIRLTPVKIRR